MGNPMSNKYIQPKIIIVKIDIGGKGRAITKEGKISIISNPYDPNCKLTPVNIRKIAAEFTTLIS